MRLHIAVLTLLLLAACGPVPLPVAEQQCIEQARLAQHPRGEVSVGVNSDGQVVGGMSLGVSTDYLQGRDPSQVYDQCVLQRSGQMPSRPFYTLPKG